MSLKTSSVPVLSLFLAFGLVSAHGAEPSLSLPTVLVRTGEHATFDRIVFDAPVNVKYEIQRKEGVVSLFLSLPARLKETPWLPSRARNLEIAKGADGKEPLVLRFRVSPKARLKDFMSGKSIVIDVTGEALPASTAQEQQKPKPDEREEAPARAQEGPIKEAAVQEKTEQTQSSLVQDALLAQQEKTDQSGAESLAPNPQPAPVKKVENSEPLSTIATPRTPLPLPLPVEEAARLKAITLEKPAQPVAVFDSFIMTGAVVFERGGYVTVLFDRKLLGPIVKDSPSPRVRLEPLDLSRWTGFRFPVPSGVGVRANRKETAWEIYLMPSDAAPAVSTEFVSQPDFALGARLLLSTAQPPAPILFEDPVVGDTLIAIPFMETGAFTMPRKLADFEVIPAAQGLVIKPWHEKVVARAVPDGIEITAEGGLKLSPSGDTGLFGETAQVKRLFDFERWRGRDGESFTATRQKLMQTIVEVSEKEKVLARMELARFYFANGMARESLALLYYIQKGLPEIENQPEFLGLRGACRVLVGDLVAGVTDLSHESLSDQMESLLWQAVALAKMRDWPAAMDRFRKAESVLDGYREPFLSRVRILMIETALAYGQTQEAEMWLNALEKGVLDPSAKTAAKYLRGVYYASTKRLDKAGVLWREALKEQDRLYKIRAELALVDLGVVNKSLTPKQAIDRLEGLRFAWRGDDLEFDILRRLGGFYLDAKEFKKGFGVFLQATRLFPKGPQTLALKAEMIRKFKDVLSSDLGAELSPIEALTLYTDFGFLIPPGEEGNEVRNKLAEEMVRIDLLDQAAKLLEDVIRNASSPEEKTKVSTRLAGVRLLDHRAQDALDVLDKTESESAGASEKARNDRKLLRARALSELGRHEEALAALPSEAGTASKILRADISVRARRWEEAAATLIELVGPPPPTEQKLSVEQAEWLVNAALALSQKGDLEALDKLALMYDPAMGGSSKADLFRVLTRPEKISQFKDLAAAQSKLSEVDMFQGFLNMYRQKE